MIITAIVQQARDKGRYSIYIDGKFAFGLSDTALLNSRIIKGQELTPDDAKRLKQLSQDDKVYGNALRYIAMRPRSQWELQTYLQRKGASPAVAEDILKRLGQQGLLDDEAFARSWVESRRLLKATSRRKLSLELKQKHIASEVIDRVLSQDRDVVDELSVLRDIVERKRSRYPDRLKFMQYLARQGFGYDDIKQALDDPAKD